MDFASMVWNGMDVNNIRNSFDYSGITSNNYNTSLKLVLVSEKHPSTVLVDAQDGDSLLYSNFEKKWWKFNEEEFEESETEEDGYENRDEEQEGDTNENEESYESGKNNGSGKETGSGK